MPSIKITINNTIKLKPLKKPNTNHFSITIQYLKINITSLILTSNFIPLSQTFYYYTFSPNYLPPKIHIFFIKLLYRIHINLPYYITLHLKTLKNLNQI